MDTFLDRIEDLEKVTDILPNAVVSLEQATIEDFQVNILKAQRELNIANAIMDGKMLPSVSLESMELFPYKVMNVTREGIIDTMKNFFKKIWEAIKKFFSWIFGWMKGDKPDEKKAEEVKAEALRLIEYLKDKEFDKTLTAEKVKDLFFTSDGRYKDVGYLVDTSGISCTVVNEATNGLIKSFTELVKSLTTKIQNAKLDANKHATEGSVKNYNGNGEEVVESKQAAAVAKGQDGDYDAWPVIKALTDAFADFVDVINNNNSPLTDEFNKKFQDKITIDQLPNVASAMSASDEPLEKAIIGVTPAKISCLLYNRKRLDFLRTNDTAMSLKDTNVLLLRVTEDKLRLDDNYINKAVNEAMNKDWVMNFIKRFYNFDVKSYDARKDENDDQKAFAELKELSDKLDALFDKGVITFFGFTIGGGQGPEATLIRSLLQRVTTLVKAMLESVRILRHMVSAIRNSKYRISFLEDIVKTFYGENAKQEVSKAEAKPDEDPNKKDDDKNGTKSNESLQDVPAVEPEITPVEEKPVEKKIEVNPRRLFGRFR